MTLLYFINTIDMQGRLVKQPAAHIQKNYGQGDSHTYSYLQLREVYQSIGTVMGLDKLIENKQISNTSSNDLNVIIDNKNSNKNVKLNSANL